MVIQEDFVHEERQYANNPRRSTKKKPVHASNEKSRYHFISKRSSNQNFPGKRSQ